VVPLIFAVGFCIVELLSPADGLQLTETVVPAVAVNTILGRCENVVPGGLLHCDDPSARIFIVEINVVVV
jgi:hypothetical protein